MARIDYTEPELKHLAEQLAPYLQIEPPDEDYWMQADKAAWYLGMTPKALRRRIERRTTDNNPIPAHQDMPGGKFWFKRSELDRWRHSL